MAEKRGRRGQIEYAWVFSLLVGALIIFLSVFSAQKYKQTAEVQVQSEFIRKFDILLNPFSSVGSIATMTLSKAINLPAPLQLNFTCNSKENHDELNLRTKSGKNWGEWLKQGFKIKDKYVFAGLLEGARLWVFSKPFEMPWRVDDLTYITDKSYCFDSPPDSIQREIDSLKTNSIFANNEAACPPDSIEVCFGERKCDINVDYGHGLVKKAGKSMAFAGDALMYAAIFSDPDVYQCNIERLTQRLKTQIDINLQKAIILQNKGCGTEALQSRLEDFRKAVENGGNFSAGIIAAANAAADENTKECPVFD